MHHWDDQHRVEIILTIDGEDTNARISIEVPDDERPRRTTIERRPNGWSAIPSELDPRPVPHRSFESALAAQLDAVRLELGRRLQQSRNPPPDHAG